MTTWETGWTAFMGATFGEAGPSITASPEPAVDRRRTVDRDGDKVWSSFRVVVVAPPGHEAAGRVASAFCTTPRAPDEASLPQDLARGDVVHAFLPVEACSSLAARLVLARVPAALLTPTGAPRAMPWWAWRFRRLVLATQPEARAWTAHVSLGRIAVVDALGGTDTRPASRSPTPSDTELRSGLAALYTEAVEMAPRLARRPRSG
jgi:hypothetical protein